MTSTMFHKRTDRPAAGSAAAGCRRGIAVLSGRGAALLIGLWVLAAALANVMVPQLEGVVEAHARSFMPSDAPSAAAAARAAELFGQKPSNNFVYVVLERNQPLTTADRQFYDSLMAVLGADPRHVNSVTDLWSNPATAAGALSPDGRAVTAMVRLSGMLGTAQAGDSVNSIRSAVQRLRPPPGLQVHVSGPGATIVDEFAAIDRQLLEITAATVGMILLLLLAVYRSPVAAGIPLMSVGLALALARAVIAALGQADLVEVSLFSVALTAAMTLGAGTDYAIFLIGRYHEGRRHDLAPARALADAYRAVAPVVIGSALTVSVALGVLVFAKVGSFRSTGIPCAIGILVTMAASLTLTPALMHIAVRRGLLEPRPSTTARRWRRIGAIVVRWPAPILLTAGGLTLLLMIPLAGFHVGWNEPAGTPGGADSNRGYRSAERHFNTNSLLPDIVAIKADHDLRNPAGLIAIERITRQIMAVPGVRKVQSASRPAGTVPEEATLTDQTGVISRQLSDTMDALNQRLARLSELDSGLARMQAAVDQLGNGLRGASGGLGIMSTAVSDMRTGMDGLQHTATTVSGYLDPLRNFIDHTPDCDANPLCANVDRVVQPVDALVVTSTQLSGDAATLAKGSTATAAAMAKLPNTVATMRDALGQARSATANLRGLTDTLRPQMSQLTSYLNELAAGFQGSAAGGFYLPRSAFADPRYQAALHQLISTDGRAAYLQVYGDGAEWGTEGAARADQIRSAITEATKEGTLTPTEVDLAGVGPVTADLQRLVAADTTLLVAAALALIFLIVTVMLKSPIAGLVVVGTVVTSYASALGASILIWQHLLHHDLHWSVAPIAFIALIAVGADYNLLLALRIKDEAAAGVKTGIIRAFGGTGGVVTTAGIVFGLTMLALLTSSVLSIAQIGTTIAVGLLLDTLIVRAFIVPAIVALLGSWFWWPRLPRGRTPRGENTTGTTSPAPGSP